MGGAAPKAAGAPARPAKKVEEEEEDDDDFDMFGSDDEVDEEAERIKAERLAAYAEKKSKKPALIAKSNIIQTFRFYHSGPRLSILLLGDNVIAFSISSSHRT